MIQYDSKISKNYNFLVRFYIELLTKKVYNNNNKYLRTKQMELEKRGDKEWRYIFFRL